MRKKKVIVLIEVIVQNDEEAIEAEKLGADRLELVAAIQEGGLTPSYGTIKQVLHSVRIPVSIMIRPHSYHYVYNQTDLQIILEDIYQVLELGGNQIVFGALNEDGTVNETMVEHILSISPDLRMTFHRAFDEVLSLTDAYKTLTNYKEQVTYILTSGGKSSCVAGSKKLQQLVKIEQLLQGPNIMPGAGLNAKNINDITQKVQATYYHRRRAVRKNETFSQPIDSSRMKQLVNLLNDT